MINNSDSTNDSDDNSENYDITDIFLFADGVEIQKNDSKLYAVDCNSKTLKINYGGTVDFQDIKLFVSKESERIIIGTFIENNCEISLSSLPAGIYIIEIRGYYKNGKSSYSFELQLVE